MVGPRFSFCCSQISLLSHSGPLWVCPRTKEVLDSSNSTGPPPALHCYVRWKQLVARCNCHGVTLTHHNKECLSEWVNCLQQTKFSLWEEETLHPMEKECTKLTLFLESDLFPASPPLLPPCFHDQPSSSDRCVKPHDEARMFAWVKLTSNWIGPQWMLLYDLC